jgi:hypothetical protein
MVQWCLPSRRQQGGRLGSGAVRLMARNGANSGVIIAAKSAIVVVHRKFVRHLIINSL